MDLQLGAHNRVLLHKQGVAQVGPEKLELTVIRGHNLAPLLQSSLLMVGLTSRF